MRRLTRDVLVLALGGAAALWLHEVHQSIALVRAMRRGRLW